MQQAPPARVSCPNVHTCVTPPVRQTICSSSVQLNRGSMIIALSATAGKSWHASERVGGVAHHRPQPALRRRSKTWLIDNAPCPAHACHTQAKRAQSRSISWAALSPSAA
eukprot:2270156-Rhodomonas_salina.1